MDFDPKTKINLDIENMTVFDLSYIQSIESTVTTIWQLFLVRTVSCWQIKYPSVVLASNSLMIINQQTVILIGLKSKINFWAIKYWSYSDRFPCSCQRSLPPTVVSQTSSFRLQLLLPRISRNLQTFLLLWKTSRRLCIAGLGYNIPVLAWSVVQTRTTCHDSASFRKCTLSDSEALAVHHLQCECLCFL